eukprot:2489588-Rhodomonas_salina.3
MPWMAVMLICMVAGAGVVVSCRVGDEVVFGKADIDKDGAKLSKRRRVEERGMGGQTEIQSCKDSALEISRCCRGEMQHLAKGHHPSRSLVVVSESVRLVDQHVAKLEAKNGKEAIVTRLGRTPVSDGAAAPTLSLPSPFSRMSTASRTRTRKLISLHTDVRDPKGRDGQAGAGAGGLGEWQGKVQRECVSGRSGRDSRREEARAGWTPPLVRRDVWNSHGLLPYAFPMKCPSTCHRLSCYAFTVLVRKWTSILRICCGTDTVYCPTRSLRHVRY